MDIDRNPAWLRRYALLFAGLCALLVAALSFAYTFLAWPVADDICRALIGPSLAEKREYVWHLYNTLTGRWITVSAYTLFMPNIGITGPGYTIALLLLQGAWLLMFYAVVRMLIGDAVRRRTAAAAAIGLALLFWTGMPGPAEVWYWVTGGFEYGLPMLVAVGAFAALVRIGMGKAGPANALIAALLGAIAAGMNELPALLLLIAGICWAIGLFAAGNRKGALLATASIAVTAASFLITVSAPGNAVRALTDAVHPGSPLNLVRAFVRLDLSPLAWFGDPRLLAASAALLATPAVRALPSRWAGRPWAMLVPIVLLGMVLGGYCAVWFAQGKLPAARVMDVLYALFLVAWATVIVIAATRLGPIAPATRAQYDLLAAAGFAVLGIATITATNVVVGAGDLRYAATDWQRYEADRFDRQGTVRIETSRWRPLMTKWEDIRPERDQWLHACYRDYLGSELVIEP